MWRSLRDIINKRFTTLSLQLRIQKIIAENKKNNNSSVRSRASFFLIFLLTAISLFDKAGGEIVPRVRDTFRWRNSRNSELLYLGYGGNPWGTSSPAMHQDQNGGFLWRTRSNPTSPSNDFEPTKTPAIKKITSSLRRSKRGVVHLYNMVWCATGCNPLAYKGYGCYCGFLGSGFTIDGIDRCCKMHDWCYEATDCPMFMEYFVPYYWKCYRGNKPICAVEHGDWGGSGSCSQRLCECDRVLAECLRKYPCPNTKAMCTSSPWRLVQNLFMLI